MADILLILNGSKPTLIIYRVFICYLSFNLNIYS